MDSEPSSSAVRQEELGSCDSGGVVMRESCDPMTHSQNLEKYPSSSNGAEEIKPDSKSVLDGKYGSEEVYFSREVNQEAGFEEGMPIKTGSKEVCFSRDQEAGLASSASNSTEQVGGPQVVPQYSDRGEVIGASSGGDSVPLEVVPESSGHVFEGRGDGSCDSVAGAVQHQINVGEEGEGRPPRPTDTQSDQHGMETEFQEIQTESRDLKETMEMGSQEKLNETETEEQEEMEVESHDKGVESHDKGKEMKDESHDKGAEMEVESHDKGKEMEVVSHDKGKEMEVELHDSKMETQMEKHDVKMGMGVESHDVRKEKDELKTETMQVEEETKALQFPEKQGSQLKSHNMEDKSHPVEDKLDVEWCDKVTGLSLKTLGNKDIQSSLNMELSVEIPDSNIKPRLKVPEEQEVERKEVNPNLEWLTSDKMNEIQSILKEVEPQLEEQVEKQAVEKEVESRRMESESIEVSLEKPHDKVDGVNESESGGEVEGANGSKGNTNESKSIGKVANVNESRLVEGANESESCVKVEGANGSESGRGKEEGVNECASKEDPVFPHTALWSELESGDDPKTAEGGQEMTLCDREGESHDLLAGKEVESVGEPCGAGVGSGEGKEGEPHESRNVEDDLCGVKGVESLQSNDKQVDQDNDV